MDDILISSNLLEGHLAHLNTFFKITTKNKISIHFQKSNFLCQEVRFLDYELDQYGGSIDPVQVYALNNFVPKRRKDIEKINRLLNWYRNVIPNCSLKVIFLQQKYENQPNSLGHNKFKMAKRNH